MRSHFVAKYIGPENEKFLNYSDLGSKQADHFLKGAYKVKRTKSGIDLEKDELGLKISISFDMSQDNFTELHEIDIDGEEDSVKSARIDLEKIYQSCKFSIL